MFKKIILATATFAIVCVAYLIYQWQDDTLLREHRARPDAVPPPVSSHRFVTTRPSDAADLADQALTFRDFRVPSGKAPVFHMYDRKGHAKIIFRSTRNPAPRPVPAQS